jgi:hypothetical protein
VFGYLDITVSLPPAGVRGAEIEFSIPDSWFDGSVDPESVALLRYVNNEWVPLTTELVSSASGERRYRATTQGFSYFAIAAAPTAGNEPVDAPVVEAETTVTTDETPAEPAPAEPVVEATEEPETEKSAFPWLLVLLFAAAIGMSAIIYFTYGKED